MKKFGLIFVALIFLIAAILFPEQKLLKPPAPKQTGQVALLTFKQQKNEQYRFTLKYKLTIKNAKNSILTVKIPLPQTIEGKQQVSDLEYSIQPENILDEKENKFAYFKIENPKPQTEIVITGKVKPTTYDLARAKKHPITAKYANTAQYLGEENLIETNDPSIIALGKSLNSTKGVYKTVANIYYYVQKHLRYTDAAEAKGAKETLRTHKGKCTDYAALMVALCRVNSIPARIVTGNTIDEKGAGHAWVEVYFEELGWVTFEPTIISNQRPNISKNPYKYLIRGYNIYTDALAKLEMKYYGVKKPHLTPLMTLDTETKFEEEE